MAVELILRLRAMSFITTDGGYTALLMALHLLIVPIGKILARNAWASGLPVVQKDNARILKLTPPDIVPHTAELLDDWCYLFYDSEVSDRARRWKVVHAATEETVGSDSVKEVLIRVQGFIQSSCLAATGTQTRCELQLLGMRIFRTAPLTRNVQQV